ncbi:STAS domain-containing protein [Bacillus shivajii]|uniref:RsbT co-antagonist protein RsbRA n=1 Tax=Bacillus shivajii TaxID=1983719 RepID=UPI001CF96D87|nr:RsbT co-antagonist protein RsbRA [Bacillus shivajii]UCZ53685.1 STAS domain-containing protein [Bacillus shivajii]
MNSFIRELIINSQNDIVDEWLKEITQFRSQDQLQNITDAMYENTNREFVTKLISTVDKNETEFQDELIEFTEKLIQLGWPLNYITRGLQEFRKITVEKISQEGSNPSQTIEYFQEVENWIDGVVNILVNEYSGSWENTVFLQKMALKELSAPLIPVVDKISVMPLIGTIDTERARLIMENLLDGVINHRSEVVLIDITGVPVVDTMVAHHIIQAADAVRLIGSKCILVGIRPEIAQTIVNLGIDLSKFPTKSSMKKGMEAALEITNRKIVDIEN